MNATDLIKYIYENNKVEYVLSELNCVYIANRGKEYRCGLPNDYNKTRVRIKNNEYLNITVFQSNDKIIKGNIITLVMEVRNFKFIDAIKYIHSILGLKYSYDSTKKQELKNTPLDIFKKIKKNINKNNINEIKTYDDNILNCYVRGIYIDWFKEGILPFTAEEFNLGYDAEHKRIIMPHSKWDSLDNKYVGIMGRTTVKNFDLLDIPKYFPLIPFAKGLNLYGLKENYKTIIENGYVVVHEAEKSVLKRHSRLDGTGVALCCHDFDDRNEQVKILLGLNVDIIIAMDKGININHIRSMCDKFYYARNIYYIWDKYDILDDKEAPADRPDKIYKFLLKHKIKYDEHERDEYYKWLESLKKN